MLSPIDAVNGMSNLLGTTAISVKYFTRLMREDGHGLWLELGKGNRGSVKLRHLVNLWMAYALCGGQPGNGPRAAREFGQLRMVGDVKRTAIFHPLPPNANLLSGLTPDEIHEVSSRFGHVESKFLLVDHLCSMVREIVETLRRSPWESPRHWPVISITLGSLGHSLSAEVTWPNQDKPHDSEIDIYAIDTVDEDTLPGIDIPTPPRNKLFRTQVIVGLNEIIAFASLAMKTDDFDLLPLSEPAPASAGDGNDVPETKEATGPASRGDLNAKPSTSRAYPALVPTATSNGQQSATKQGSKQLASVSVAHESRVRQPAESSRLTDYQPPIVKDRHHGTNWSAASPA